MRVYYCRIADRYLDKYGNLCIAHWSKKTFCAMAEDGQVASIHTINQAKLSGFTRPIVLDVSL